MRKVTLYSMQNCPYCVRAKGLLTQRGVEHETIMVDNWPDAEWDQLAKKSGMKTLPQIFIDGDFRTGKLIGGYSQLAEVDAKGEVAGWK
jgi:glutaredoxin 3